jgi:apolipoprotein N-acyltransferase
VSKKKRPKPGKASPRGVAVAAEPAAPVAGRPRLDWARFGQLAALSVLSGCMWFLACADHDIWPLAWIAMVPSLWAIEKAPTHRQAVWLGWLAGLTANVGGFYWVAGMLERFGHLPMPVAVLGLLLLCGYQALVFALFAHVVRRLRATSAGRRGRPLPMVLLAPLVMVAFELMVPFVFPWYLAITQAWVVPVIQVADLAGPLGVTALLLMVNGAIYDAVVAGERRARLVPLGAAAAVMAAALAYGFVRIHQVEATRAAAPALKVGVVQGNISFDEKGLKRQELAAGQLRDLQRVSAELEADGAELLLWTESSYPYRIPRDRPTDFDLDDPRRIRRGFTRPLVLGAVTADLAEPERSPYNSAVMLGSDDRVVARFDKIFLLVFGEYIPLYETFRWVRSIMPKNAGHFSRGESIVTFPFEHEGVEYRLGPMICYEDILTDFNRELGKLRPHLLINLTNDAWYGDTAEPWEHLALSVYRSVELRTDLVRAVNTGVSAFIDGTGRVYAETYAIDPKIDPRPAEGLLEEVRLVEGGHTVYARVGDVFGWLCAALTLVGWLVWPRVRRRAARPAS